MSVLLIALACSDPTPCYGTVCVGGTSAATTATTAAATTSGTNPFWDVPAPADPSRAADESIALALDALNAGMPNAFDLRNTYRDFMIVSETMCPTRENKNAETWTGVWNSDCETSDGYHFYGTAIYDEMSSKDGASLAVAMVASFELTDPDNQTFIGGGGFSLERSVIDGVTNIHSSIGGTYSYPPAAGWLGDGIEASLFTVGETTSDSTLVEFDGGVGYDTVDIYLTDVWIDSAVCGGAIQGAINIRDPTGYWLTLEFSDCSGCARLLWNAEDRGEVCPDGGFNAALHTLLDRLEGETIAQ